MDRQHVEDSDDRAVTLAQFVNRTIWVGLVENDENVEYLYRVGRRFLFLYNVSSLVTVIGSTVAFAAILNRAPNPIYMVASGIVVTIALLSLLFRLAERHAAATSMAESCRVLSREWRRLWTRSGDPEEDLKDLLHAARDLEERLEAITADTLHKLGNVQEKLQKDAVTLVHQRVGQEFEIG